MCAISANALYTTWRKRGTTRQLAVVIVSCVCAALLLLPAILWYNARFNVSPASVGIVEAALALIYVALWGCVVPLGATTAYCLYTRPRDSHTSARIPRHRAKRTTKGNAAAVATVRPPRREPGVPAPFVYSNDIPWGWLEHRAGRFQGQRLALKRAVISIGREEDNEIWLDDETSSRYHAELAWQDGQIYITDCDSLNGVILNGRRMRGTLPVNSGDFLEIGSHRFLFEVAPRPVAVSDQDDPLLLHGRRSPISLDNIRLDKAEAEAYERNPASFAAPPTKPVHESLFADAISPAARNAFDSAPQSTPGAGVPAPDGMPTWMHAFRPDPVTPQPLPIARDSVCLIQSGSLAGKSFRLDRPALVVGSSPDCDIRLDDASISVEYARFSRQPEGEYITGPGVQVNGELLLIPHLLQPGDAIILGSTMLEYSIVSDALTTPMPLPPAPPLAPPVSGPTPFLRLPSKPK